MLVDKTVKMELEAAELLDEVQAVIAQVQAGQALPKVLFGEAFKLLALGKDVMALPDDVKESLCGTLTAVAVGLVRVGCQLFGAKVDA